MRKLLLFLIFSFICSVGFADTVTYYFNAYDEGGEEWFSYPERMVDGATGTVAGGMEEEIQLLTGNTCRGTDLGTITKVELRAYGTIGGFVAGVLLRPVFSGSSDGDDHNLSEVSDDWTDYVDITSDTNAPGTWSWTNVQNLDCDAEVYGGMSAGVAKVEIRVTYTGDTGVTVTPAADTITLTLQTPTVSGVRNVTVTPDADTITLTLQVPTIEATIKTYTKLQGATLQGATLN